MSPATKILFSFVLLVLEIEASNLNYAFDENDFNFSTWRDSDDGFDCGRDHQYLILCKHRWNRITSNLDYCSVQCASGGKAILTAIVVVESITIVVLLLYIYRKPRIAEKERMDVQTLISRNFKHSSNHQLLVDNKI